MDLDNESNSNSNSLSIFVLAKKKGRRYVRDSESSNDDNSSSNNLGDRRKQGSILKIKRNSKIKKTKSIGSNNQSDMFTSIMQKFMK